MTRTVICIVHEGLDGLQLDPGSNTSSSTNSARQLATMTAESMIELFADKRVLDPGSWGRGDLPRTVCRQSPWHSMDGYV